VSRLTDSEALAELSSPARKAIELNGFVRCPTHRNSWHAPGLCEPECLESEPPQQETVPPLVWRGIVLARDEFDETECYQSPIQEGWTWSVRRNESGRYLAWCDVGPGRFDVMGDTPVDALEKCRTTIVRRYRGLLEQLEAMPL
jgi:hypothetical protein